MPHLIFQIHTYYLYPLNVIQVWIGTHEYDLIQINLALHNNMNIRVKRSSIFWSVLTLSCYLIVALIIIVYGPEFINAFKSFAKFSNFPNTNRIIACSSNATFEVDRWVPVSNRRFVIRSVHLIQRNAAWHISILG